MKKVAVWAVLSVLLLSLCACALGEASAPASTNTPPLYMRVAWLLQSKARWTSPSGDFLMSDQWFVFGDDSGVVYMMKKDDSHMLFRVFLAPDTSDPSGQTIRLVIFNVSDDGTKMRYRAIYE
ncbi:MAG: hypothetical protein IKS31_11680 [Clostridia bacterium]|nr:hypothetical protein [Clostridia bacterium]